MDEPIDRGGEAILAMLVHLMSRRPSGWVTVGDLFHIFSVRQSQMPLLERTIENLESNNYINSMEASDIIGRTFIRVTLPGRAFLKARYGNQSDILIYEYAKELPAKIAGEISKTEALDSASWTGRHQKRLDDPLFIDDIRKRVFDLQRDIEDSELSNFEKSCAISVSGALISLLDSPKPEWHLISELLRSPVFNASLAVAGLVQFILAMIV